MRFTVDTNILVYAVDRTDSIRHPHALEIMLRAVDADFVLTVQAVGEFLNVARRKRPDLYPEARSEAERWLTLYPVVPTYSNVLLEAADLAQRHKLQLWDSIIWQAARQVNTEIFVTEDLHDGLVLDGMRVVNPFHPSNAALVRELLRPMET